MVTNHVVNFWNADDKKVLMPAGTEVKIILEIPVKSATGTIMRFKISTLDYLFAWVNENELDGVK